MFAKIPVTVVIPVMIVLDPSMFAVPVSGKVARSIVSGANPVGTGVGGARPIAGVPSIPVSDRVPIARDPRITRAGARRNRDHSGWWRRPDGNPYSNLGK